MSTIIKTVGQVSFVEIVDRLKAVGLNQADVARELQITRSAVTMILNGKRQPGPGTMFMLKDLDKRMGTAGPEKPDMAKIEINRLTDKLALLQQEDRPSFDAAKRFIHTMAPASSKSPSLAKQLLRKAAVGGPKSGPK